MGSAIFPKWTNLIKPILGIVVIAVPAYGFSLLYYGAHPSTLAVGYMPKQPIEYSHALHAGELGIDCRYCHNTVEEAGHAAIPPTQTCMNCHNMIRTDSDKIALLKQSQGTGLPVEWKRVHDLPDFAYFNHSAHVRRGVGCVECHGRVDKMEKVWQENSLVMAWCLECHRNPTERLRPLDKITDMDWEPAEGRFAVGKRIQEKHNINPSTDCATCHR